MKKKKQKKKEIVYFLINLTGLKSFLKDDY